MLRWNCNWQLTERHTLSISIHFLYRRIRSRNARVYTLSKQYKTNESNGWCSIILESEIKAVAKRQWRIDEINWTEKLLSAVERKLFFVLKLSQIKFSSVSCATEDILCMREIVVCFVLSIGWCSMLVSNPLFAVAVRAERIRSVWCRRICRIECFELSSSRAHDSTVHICTKVVHYYYGVPFRFVSFLASLAASQSTLARARIFSLSRLMVSSCIVDSNVYRREYGVNRGKRQHEWEITEKEKKRNTNFLAEFNWQCLDTRTTTNMCNVHSHLAWCNTCQDETGNIIRKR